MTFWNALFLCDEYAVICPLSQGLWDPERKNWAGTLYRRRPVWRCPPRSLRLSGTPRPSPIILTSSPFLERVLIVYVHSVGQSGPLCGYKDLQKQHGGQRPREIPPGGLWVPNMAIINKLSHIQYMLSLCILFSSCVISAHYLSLDFPRYCTRLLYKLMNMDDSFHFWDLFSHLKPHLFKHLLSPNFMVEFTYL